MKTNMKVVAVAMGVVLLVPQLAQGQDADRRERREVLRMEVDRRGWIGISFDREELDAGRLVVDEVASESPADEAGIRSGDRVVRWNGSTEVAEALRSARLQPGDTVNLRIASSGGAERDVSIVAEPRGLFVERRAGRDGDVVVVRPDELVRRLRLRQGALAESLDSLHSRLQLLLRDSLGPRLEDWERRIPRARIELLRDDSLFFLQDGLARALAGGRSAVAGAALADVTAGLGSYFGTETGALVLRVAPDSPAEEAGLREGDVIVRANGEEILDVDDLRREIGPPLPPGWRLRPERAPAGVVREDVPLEIIRQGSRYSLTLPR